MSHSNYRELMAASLDALLAPDDRAALDAHLETCQACRTVWEALAEMHISLAAAPHATAPAGFAERTAARLAARSSRRRVWGGGFILLAGVLGVAALAALPLGGSLVALAGQPDMLIALARILATLFDVAGAVGGGLWLAVMGLLDWTVAQPLAMALAVAALPLAWLWLYVFRRLSPKAVSVR
jgi:anti-sigma factor RsiW